MAPPDAPASTTGREALDASLIARPDGLQTPAGAAPTGKLAWSRIKRGVGLCLLTVTILLWTTTNFLASDIFADDTYSKPYFVTYINTAFFIIPLLPRLVYNAWRNPEQRHKWKSLLSFKGPRDYAAVKMEEGDVTSYHDSPVIRPADGRRRSLSPPPDVLLGEAAVMSQELPPMDPKADTSSSAPLTTWEMAKLALQFSMLWFSANYFVAACLQFTTVASSTILTSFSSVFTLLFGALFRVEKFTLRKCLGVGASLAGIVLISSLDFSGRSNDEDHRGNFPDKPAREMALGDCLAFVSAVMYGLYAVFLKKQVPDESRIDMITFFGFVGIINSIVLLPGFFILHFTGFETFELPPNRMVLTIVLLNSLGSLVSDICWAYAVLLTSPIVVTLGLSITIPLSLIGQIWINGQTAGPWYWLGACIVVLSFFFVNHEEKKDEEEATGDITAEGYP